MASVADTALNHHSLTHSLNHSVLPHTLCSYVVKVKRSVVYTELDGNEHADKMG